MSINIGVIGDLHLTNTLPHTLPGDIYRKEQLKKFINFFIRKLIEFKVGVLCVCGDLCHRTMLESDDLDLLMYFLNAVNGSGIKTLIVNGNHDVDNKKSILKFLRHSYRTYPGIICEGHNHWEESFNDFNIKVINYCSDEEFMTFATNPPESKKPTILISHIGVKNSLHGTTKSLTGVKIEDIEKISKLYDMVFFGHHHKFQKLTSNCFYTGAFQQTRADEFNTVPGGLIYSFDKKKIKRISNKFSPRFLLVDEATELRKIKDQIIKPVVDLVNKTEAENRVFIEKIRKYDPYNIIVPRLKKVFLTSISMKKSETDKKKALLRIIKKTTIEKRKREEYTRHVLDLYEKISQEV